MKYWAIIPAAGVGRRMQSDIPKQYMPLHGRPVIEHTVQRLAQIPVIEKIIIAVSSGDPYWENLIFDVTTPIQRVDGGEERCHSVLNALNLLQSEAEPTDWILVHDAARLCVRPSDIETLINTLAEHPVGGLLAFPVRDTMKRSTSDADVIQTVERADLWHALTPQMFRFAELHQALIEAVSGGHLVTDEAGAIEQAGKQPKLVEGHADNIKITRPEDLELAAFYLRQQNQQGEISYAAEWDDGG